MTRSRIPARWKNEIARWAASEPLVLRVIAYGSQARGDADEGSDLDLALTFDVDDSDAFLGEWHIFRRKIAAQFVGRIEVPVDVRWFEHPGADETWLTDITKDGIELYRRG